MLLQVRCLRAASMAVRAALCRGVAYRVAEEVFCNDVSSGAASPEAVTR